MVDKKKYFVLLLLLLASVTAYSENPTSVPTDTTQTRRSWIDAMKGGKPDFSDTTVHYPRFVKWAWGVYKWGDKAFNSYDTAYVVGVGKNWKITLKNNNWLERYECTPEKDQYFTFVSGAASSVGAYLSFMAITVGYSIDVDRFVGDRPTSNKMEMSFTCARFTAEFFRMSNHGNMTVTLKDKDDGQTYRATRFPGLYRRSWGLSAYYFFNNRKYAQAAPYCFSKVQRRSAGSWLAGFNITHQNFTVNYKEMLEDWPAEEVETETAFDYTDYCASVGYGYNWALSPRWVLNGTLLLHAGPKHSHTASTSDGGHTYFGVNGKARLAVTYSGRRFFASVQGYIDGRFFNTGDYGYRSYLYDLTAVFGARF